MKEFIEKKTTEVKWELMWDGTAHLLHRNGGLWHGDIYHERDLPPEVFEAFKDEIRAKREMGPDEMMGPTGYVRFEMRDGEAVAVTDYTQPLDCPGLTHTERPYNVSGSPSGTSCARSTSKRSARVGRLRVTHTGGILACV